MNGNDDAQLKRRIEDAWRRSPESRVDYPTLVGMTEAMRAVAVRDGLIPEPEPDDAVPDLQCIQPDAAQRDAYGFGEQS